VVDFVRRWSEKNEIGAGRFIHGLGITASKFYDRRERYGRVNEHNGWVPRDFWLEPCGEGSDREFPFAESLGKLDAPVPDLFHNHPQKKTHFL
jgi:hypothetical protein